MLLAAMPFASKPQVRLLMGTTIDPIITDAISKSGRVCSMGCYSG